MLVKTTHNHVQPWLACPLSRGGKAFIMAEKARARGEEVRTEEVRRRVGACGPRMDVRGPRMDNKRFAPKIYYSQNK